MLLRQLATGTTSTQHFDSVRLRNKVAERSELIQVLAMAMAADFFHISARTADQMFRDIFMSGVVVAGVEAIYRSNVMDEVKLY
jgi:hypothetical protein